MTHLAPALALGIGLLLPATFAPGLVAATAKPAKTKNDTAARARLEAVAARFRSLGTHRSNGLPSPDATRFPHPSALGDCVRWLPETLPSAS